MSTYDPTVSPVMAIFSILASGEAQDDGDDGVGDNPTGNPRKSSARKRRQKLRKLFEGTQWAPERGDQA